MPGFIVHMLLYLCYWLQNCKKGCHRKYIYKDIRFEHLDHSRLALLRPRELSSLDPLRDADRERERELELELELEGDAEREALRSRGGEGDFDGDRLSWRFRGGGCDGDFDNLLRGGDVEGARASGSLADRAGGTRLGLGLRLRLRTRVRPREFDRDRDRDLDGDLFLFSLLRTPSSSS